MPPTSTPATGEAEAEAEAPASPSPPPAPPIAQTPGPRAKKFIEVYELALSRTLASVSYASFAACFPSIAAQAPAALKGMHGSMVGRLEAFARDEFETILAERNVVERLNLLEDLIAEGRRRKARGEQEEEEEGRAGGEAGRVRERVIPHTLPAASLLRSHTTPLHQSQQSHLNAKLQTTESQNATLIEEVRRQRAEIEELLKLGEILVGDLEGAGGRLGERGEELARTGREAESVLDES
ncbi:uncharacterized protein L3040_000887 [Drepanopeziza brunnea f. sp. 'multigermtubi']|uniref:uncharacterized protein n=1 Tax=Drepanopeziza brunnea f. sp. 'multigermtubi' TaxID=698441 RepID=UPI00238D2040|nr:hypothetical protein L3040_000887 [Drepanopeziza brunnea f. sp. 'multigermtubi']